MHVVGPFRAYYHILVSTRSHSRVTALAHNYVMIIAMRIAFVRMSHKRVSSQRRTFSGCHPKLCALLGELVLPPTSLTVYFDQLTAATPGSFVSGFSELVAYLCVAEHSSPALSFRNPQMVVAKRQLVAC